MMYPGERVKEILHVRHNSLNGFEDIYFILIDPLNSEN